jgi:RNA polymerase sigma factor (sigma-70 family)
MGQRPPIDAARLLEQAEWVRRLARGLVVDAAATDDIVQEVHLATLLGRGPTRGEPRAWLTAVARNLARRWRRRESVRRMHEQRAAVARSGPEGEEEALERLHLQRALADALLELHEPYRRAVIERYLDGRSYAELAARLGLTEVAARKRVSRGLELLRERLERERRSGVWSLILAFGRPPEPTGALFSLGSIALGTKLVLVVSLVLLGSAGLWLWARAEEAPGPAQVPAVAAAFEREPKGAQALPELTGDGVARGRVTAPPVAVGDTPASKARPATDSAELRGRVLDCEGRPAPGARIEIRRDRFREYSTLPTSRASAARRGELVTRTRTDATGLFSAALPSGRPFDLWVDAEGHAPASLPERFAGEFVELRLERAGELLGRVTGSRGQPVAGAELTAIKDDGSELMAFSGVTDANGEYRCRDLEPGLVRVRVSARDLVLPNDLVSLRIPAGGTLRRDFQLHEGYVVRGRVYDAETSAPVEGASVGIGWAMFQRTRTDAEGHYELRGIPRQSYDEIHAEAEGYARASSAFEFGEGVELSIDLALRRGFGADGRVLSAAGEPMERAFVAGVSRLTDPRAVRPTDWRSTETDATGSFFLPALNPEAEHALFVVCEGHGTAVVPFPPLEPGTVLVHLGDVVLRGGAAIAGSVVDERGRGIPDCQLRLFQDEHRIGRNFDDGNRWNDDEAYVGQRLGRTDGQGRFRFTDLAPGEYVLDVSRYLRGALTVTEEFDGAIRATVPLAEGQVVEGLTLEMSLADSIAGRIVSPEGEPVPCMLVWLHPVPPTREKPVDLVTGADGSFDFRALAPGSYALSAYATTIGSSGESPPYSDVEDRRVESGRRDLEIRLESIPLTRGIVLTPEGTPAIRASVMAYDALGKRVELSYTDLDGRFTLGLERGLLVTLIARAAPLDAPYWDQAAIERLDETLAARLGPVGAGDEDLELRLPAPERR